MPEPTTFQILQTDLLEHPAVKAWGALQPERTEPEQIEILKQKTTGAVYRLAGVGPGNSAIIAKRTRQAKAVIERIIYEEVLPRLPFPMLHYYGAVEGPNGEFCWLFLQDVSGDENYHPHIQEHRVAAARWLGVMNTSASGLAAAARLPERGPEHYLNLLRSARDTILSNFANPSLNADDLALLNIIVSQCDQLSVHWNQLAGVCEGMPRTLVHGDFITKNVAVRTRRDGIIFLPFDWEKSGWGVPAEDISRVDIPTYWSTVQDYWSRLNLQTLKRLANVGKVFRCLVFLDWIAPSLAHVSVEQPMDDIRRCEVWLADLIRAAGWQD